MPTEHDRTLLRSASADNPVRVETYATGPNGTRRLAGEAIFFGDHGFARAAEPAFVPIFKGAFCSPHAVPTNGATFVKGAGHGQPVTLEPWRAETLEYLAGLYLPVFGLRTRFSRAGPHELSRVGVARWRVSAYLQGMMTDIGYQAEDRLAEDVWVLEDRASDWLLRELSHRRGRPERKHVVIALIRDPEQRGAARSAIE